MKIEQYILLRLVFFAGSLTAQYALADVDFRHKAAELIQASGFREELCAPVTIAPTSDGIIAIVDHGHFFIQYRIAESNIAAEPNLIIDPNLKIPSSCTRAVIVTHGWIDKASNDWPADIARQIRNNTDPNQWVCCYFDWGGGAVAINPVDASAYARDIAGPRLARAVQSLAKFEHIHFIAHSAGCWTINEAAGIITEKTPADIHLTFLDAYIPPGWTQSTLGNIRNKKNTWADHYYTKDFTLSWTQCNLTSAHNVDITEIDPHVKEHTFPYRWYCAAIAGNYRHNDWERGDKVITDCNDVSYGFARTLEAGPNNWQKSLTLSKGNQAVKIKKPKNNFFNRHLFEKKKEGK